MARLELWFPVDPLHINQEFGANPAYYARFHDAYGNPEKGHNGRDLMAFHGQPVYASVDGTAVYTSDSHGGEGCIITTSQPADYAGGTCWFNVINWHLIGNTDPAFPPPIPMNGVKTAVKVGDLIGYANNTGAPFESSGDHLHLGLAPVDANQRVLLPANGFNGCIDPAPYFNGYFAKNHDQVLANLNKQVSLLTALVNTLTAWFSQRKQSGG